ncbi:hypothetical protein [Vibrio maritimus]|uniref:hypothetical protein n=1 Tax=Vibrio maritimus TaxID=990268 RepID=UPI001F267DEF|nr:hypothetical protein [Vibrio maritimus]
MVIARLGEQTPSGLLASFFVGTDEIKTERAVYQHIAEAFTELGTEETLRCMARFMSAVAHQQGTKLELDCDLVYIHVDPKVTTLRH